MRAFLLFLALLGTGCGWIADVTRAPAQAVGNLLLSQEQEAALGNQLATQIRQQEQVAPEPQAQQCIDRIGRTLLAELGDEPQFDYTFTVLEGPDVVNAFAIPGGHIYVYSGLVLAAEDESELASVLGHEIGHVKAGHVSDQLAAELGLQTLGALALGNNPGMVAQLATGIAAQGYLAAYSRDAEEEADTIGLRLLTGAGYDPHGMVRFFRELEEIQGSNPNFVEAFFATHPAPGARADRLARLIDDRGYATGGSEAVGCFDEAKDRLAP
ncbi:M48 family metallopeptidase [Vulgatibacter sp.]|uniref:M48 family metallopeptidase n=1 Tax=Vulgatibacter sp. TaxID=1971226 RepID=UPI00356438D5